MSTKPIDSTAATRFDLSAAALHILAMALMLMDHLWATLLPAQEWLTCAGQIQLSHQNIRAPGGWRFPSLPLWRWRATSTPTT